MNLGSALTLALSLVTQSPSTAPSSSTQLPPLASASGPSAGGPMPPLPPGHPRPGAGNPSAPARARSKPSHAKDEAPASVPLSAQPKFLQRADPMLEQGARLLQKGDVDGAVEHFRKAQPETPDERAIVEYDVGAAQLVRATTSAKQAEQDDAAAAAKARSAAGKALNPNGGVPNAPPSPGAGDAGPKIDKSALDDAKASFERAFGLAHDPRLKSEAALAAGNASANGNDVDDAIAHYRKAVVADPSNERAKKNLRRVLDAKRAQPPPPPNQGGDDDKKNDDKKNDDDKKDQDKKDGADKKDQDKKDGDDKKDQDKKDGDKKDQPQPKDGDKKDQPQPQPDKKKQKKDEAKRLLDALRARERPMTPMEMRGQQRQQAAKQGKDW